MKPGIRVSENFYAGERVSINHGGLISRIFHWLTRNFFRIRFTIMFIDGEKGIIHLEKTKDFT